MRSHLDQSHDLSDLNLGDILDAADTGLISAPVKPGKRRRNNRVKKTLTQASMIAPLLAAEGCLTVGGGNGPLGEPEPAPAPVPVPTPTPTPPPGNSGATEVNAQNDANFKADVNASIQIDTSDLLANDTHAPGDTLEVVRVFGAANGTVMLHNGVVHFTPDAGYEGMATFRYEVRDSNGNISEAIVEVHVSENHDNGHSGGHSGGHGGGDTPSHGGHGEGHPHPDDPGKAAEHMAAMNLAPVSEATHIAVNNGSWFDPSTWKDGNVPGEGAKVHIPDGVEVSYDGESNASLFTVRVDGELIFATDQDTLMEVDTLLVGMSGTLTIGTIDNPVADGVEAVIRIADNGPIDTSWDPMLLSRGVIAHGDVQIHGAQKESFLKVETDPMAGDTSLTLESPPDGWKVGDKLVLTGTHLTATEKVSPTTPRNDQTQDEELIITRIEGNVIHFDKPLVYDHDGARADLKAYVANYTRNVRFETENADGIPVHQRGHVMFMHSDDIDVRYAEFSELGRTDKSERAFDVDDIQNIQSDSNVKGRYALHIHRAGVDDLDDPAIIVGNAVWGSPGWGYVHHDSNAVLTDNAAYDVYGAAYVAETGNETGRWSHNISIKSIGNAGGAKWHEDVQAFDLGRTGAGFWFQGRLVDAVDNVAAGVPGGHGFVYMSRGNGAIPVDPATADWSESLGYRDEVGIHIPAISQFQDNEAIAVGIGLEVIKNNSEQGHDIRSVIEGFTAWEVGTGIHLQYTAHYTLRDIDLVATDQSGGASTPWRGVEFGPNSIDNVINGANIAGFPEGVFLSREETNMNNPFDGNWGYVFIDVNVDGAVTNFVNSNASDTFLTGGQLAEGRLLFDSAIDNIPAIPTPESRGSIDLVGVKTDSIGDATVSPTWDPIRIDYFTIQNALVEEGYWTLPDGRKVAAVDQYVTDRATGVVDKVTVFVEWERNFSDISEPLRYNGVLDLNDDAPVGRNDFATVSQNGSVNIDVLANDFDPDGDDINIDGFCPADNGLVSVNEDGTITYTPDPGFTGQDEFMYWVEDENGNFDKVTVSVTVDI